jgi:hypothetical protein
MLQYPSINGWRRAPHDEQCIAFKKYDGSNLRWEWNPKKGWVKYGTRRHLFDEGSPLYNQAVPIFKEFMADAISDTILHHFGKKTERITAFTEFYGDSSFAGAHDEAEPKKLVLFDVAVYKKGIIPAPQFVKMFDRRDWCAEVVYEGMRGLCVKVEAMVGWLRSRPLSTSTSSKSGTVTSGPSTLMTNRKRGQCPLFSM